jgi:hypothetical protein
MLRRADGVVKLHTDRQLRLVNRPAVMSAADWGWWRTPVRVGSCNQRSAALATSAAFELQPSSKTTAPATASTPTRRTVTYNEAQRERSVPNLDAVSPVVFYR